MRSSERSSSLAVTVYGLPTMEGRVPTFLINVAGVSAADVAARLAEQDMGVWAHDSWYSLHLYRSVGYEDQAVRLGFLHDNSVAEVDRLVEALTALASPHGGQALAPGRPAGA